MSLDNNKHFQISACIIQSTIELDIYPLCVTTFMTKIELYT